jgi:hypothetical protein
MPEGAAHTGHGRAGLVSARLRDQREIDKNASRSCGLIVTSYTLSKSRRDGKVRTKQNSSYYRTHGSCVSPCMHVACDYFKYVLSIAAQLRTASSSVTTVGVIASSTHGSSWLTQYSSHQNSETIDVRFGFRRRASDIVSRSVRFNSNRLTMTVATRDITA